MVKRNMVKNMEKKKEEQIKRIGEEERDKEMNG